jgi:hypothetical protein
MKKTKKFLISTELFGIVVLLSMTQSINMVSSLPTTFNYAAQVGDEITYKQIEDSKIYENSAENLNQFSRSDVMKFIVKNMTRINSTHMNMGYEWWNNPTSTAYCESKTKWSLNSSYSVALNNTVSGLIPIPMLPMDVNVTDIVTSNILQDFDFFEKPYLIYQNGSGITYEIEVVLNTTTPLVNLLQFSASGQLNYNVRTSNVTVMGTTITIQNITIFGELNCTYDSEHIVRNFSYKNCKQYYITVQWNNSAPQ